jgi:SEC-C motif-containing protein
MKSPYCPCGSIKLAQNCCVKYIESNHLPDSAEQLMRSRYIAYTQTNINYLLSSWHKTTRPAELDPNEFNSTIWHQLYIVETKQGLKNDNHGSVEFVAYFSNNNTNVKLHEISQFVKEDDKWFYVDGKIIANSNFQPGRNSPCYCGSSKKFKQCCLNK